MLPRLRELLREQPEIWEHIGDLAGKSRRAWIELAGGPDDVLKESLAIYADERVRDIAGDSPTPLEQLLAERIVAHQLRVLYLEATEALNPQIEGKPLGDFRLKKQEIADRQLARAVKLLANVRSLLSRTVAIEVKMPDSSDQHEKNGNGKLNVGQAQRNPTLGVNRINGHCHASVLQKT